MNKAGEDDVYLGHILKNGKEKKTSFNLRDETQNNKLQAQLKEFQRNMERIY